MGRRPSRLHGAFTYRASARMQSRCSRPPAGYFDMNGYRELPGPPPPQRSYKAAPREGVWATGPFS